MWWSHSPSVSFLLQSFTIPISTSYQISYNTQVVSIHIHTSQAITFTFHSQAKLMDATASWSIYWGPIAKQFFYGHTIFYNFCNNLITFVTLMVNHNFHIDPLLFFTNTYNCTYYSYDTKVMSTYFFIAKKSTKIVKKRKLSTKLLWKILWKLVCL